MPSYSCRWPTCTAILTQPGYCAEHAKVGKREMAAITRHYDQCLRNRESASFYRTAAWKRARNIKISNTTTCERCFLNPVEHIHHVIPLDLCTYEQSLDQKNLMGVCVRCHNKLTALERAAYEARG